MSATEAEKNDPIRIQLREPKWVDQAAMLLGPVLMLAGFVDLAYEGLESGAGFAPLVGIGMTIFGYRRFHQGICGIEMSDATSLFDATA